MGVSLPRWMLPIWCAFAWLVPIPLVFGVIPWAMSWLGTRHGWTERGPGAWNLLGLGPIAAGIAGLIWATVAGLAHRAEMPERLALDWSPKLLLRTGPYAFSRNPLYVAEEALWLGWTIFLGSIPVLVGFLLVRAAHMLVVLGEESDLEKHFGDCYREYKRTVPRWLGRRRP